MVRRTLKDFDGLRKVHDLSFKAPSKFERDRRDGLIYCPYERRTCSSAKYLSFKLPGECTALCDLTPWLYNRLKSEGVINSHGTAGAGG